MSMVDSLCMAYPLKVWMVEKGLTRNKAAKFFNIPTSTFYDMYRKQDCMVVDCKLFVAYKPNLKLQEARK